MEWLKLFFSSLYRPEYIALAISVIAVCVNVYISWKNRKYALAKEEYFKLKQVAEKIIAKLLILENHREELGNFFEYLHNAYKNKSRVIDIDNTLDKSDFEKNTHDIASWIEIYFSDLGESWNLCMDCMSKIYNIVFRLNMVVENNADSTMVKQLVDWDAFRKDFNNALEELNNTPKKISDAIKRELKKFKKENL